MSKAGGKIDLAKFREVSKRQREEAKGPGGRHRFITRAVIKLIANQLKEARVGGFHLICDEHPSRGGTGKGPEPLQYLAAATGF